MEKEETRVVAFFDILGYKSLVKEILAGDKEDGLKMFAKELEDAQNKAIDRFEDFGPPVCKRVFSDCICLSASVKGECESIVLNKIAVSIVGFQSYLLAKGVTCRGGISRGMHYEDECSIVSEGLIKAVAIEGAIGKPVVGICPDFTDSLIINEETAFDILPKGLLIFDSRHERQLFLNPFYFLFLSYSNGDEELKDLVEEAKGFIESARKKAVGSLNDPEKVTALKNKYDYLQEILDFSIGKNDLFGLHTDFKQS